MGGLLFYMPLHEAMILHGIIQAFANGSRAYFLKRDIRFSIIGTYVLGALTASVILMYFSPKVSKPILFLILGSTPFIALLLRNWPFWDMTRKPTQWACGLIVHSFQTLGGASGPVLDIFYLQGKLTRHEIVASKGFTQTLGHLFKIFFYLIWIEPASGLKMTQWNYSWIPALLLVSLIGTHTGKKILKKFNDENFKQASRILVLMIGLYYLYRGFSTL